MSRNHRQDRLFRDTCDVWRMNVPDSGTAETYTKVGSLVKYHHEWSSSKSSPSSAGRLERDIMQTLDVLHFDVGENVDQGYIVVNKTVDKFGTNASYYGSGWRVEGDFKEQRSLGGRNSNTRSVYGVRMPALPAGVS